MSKSYAIGIDLGGARLKAGVIGDDGQLIEQHIEPSMVRDSYSAVREQLSSVVARFAALQKGKLGFIGVGVAGLVDSSHRRIAASPNCPGVIGVPIADDLEAEWGAPCLLENDANAMALGERFAGAAKGCDDFVAITLGTGVGGAVISGGNLIRGFLGGGGEIGHVSIDRNGPRCSCGANGCLEAFIGMKGILRWTARKHPELKGLGVAKLVDMAKEGNAEARDVFAYVGRTLAVGLGGMVNVFNPRLLLIGGGVSSAGGLLIQPLLAELDKRAFRVYLQGIVVRAAALGNWAGVVGAGTMDRITG